MTYLEKDFASNSNKEEDIGYKGEMLKNEIKQLQNFLQAFGFPSCGDLFNPSVNDVEATVRWFVNYLLQTLKCIVSVLYCSKDRKILNLDKKYMKRFRKLKTKK